MNADSMKSPASRLERATKTMNSLVSSGWKARKWVAASLLALAALPIASPSTASAGTVVGRGFAEYYVMGDEVDLINSFKSIPSGGVSGAATAANVRSRLSIVSSSGDVSVYLDEWENGYNFDPNDPENTADAKWDASAGGPGEQGPALGVGEVLVLTEGNTFVPGSQGVDGGDRLYIAGAPVSIVRTIWPDGPSTYVSGSWIHYPTRYWDNEYQTPVGENVQFGGFPFVVCDLHVTALMDNTNVVLSDSNGTTITTTLLNRGQNTSFASVNTGYRVHGFNASTGEEAAIQAGLFTSSGNSNARAYPLVPNRFLGAEYVLPVPTMTYPATEGGSYAGQTIPTAVYVHAEDDGTTVVFETATGSSSQVLNTTQVARFLMPQVGPDFVQGPAGARVRSEDPSRKISVVVAVEDQGDNVDWGYSAIPVDALKALSSNAFLPYAPVNPIYVTPVNDGTTVKVDFENDGVPDRVVTLNRFDTVMITDPDFDLTGARVYADGPFMLVWGQDNTENSPGEPTPDFDQGYPVLPLGIFDEAFRLEKTADPAGLPSTGGKVTFTLRADNVASSTLYNINFEDVLPSGWNYVPNSSVITFTNGNPAVYVEPTGAPGPNLAWATNLTLTGAQGAILAFEAETDQTVSLGENINLGKARGTTRPNPNDSAGYPLAPMDEESVFLNQPAQTTLEVEKVSDATSQTSLADPITFTITVTNTGSATTNNVTVTDPLPLGTVAVPGSTVVVAPATSIREFRDEFWSRAYDLNAGNQNWSTNWIETLDNNSALSGNMQVVNDQGSFRLRIGGRDGSDQNFIRRSADLTGYVDPVLSFIYRRQSLDNSSDFVQVQASTTASGPWTTLATYAGPQNDAAYVAASFDMTPFISANTTIRLIASSSLGTSDYVYFDNISIRETSRVMTAYAGNDPPNLAGGYELWAGESMTVTFQVMLTQPIVPGAEDLLNSATVTSTLSDPTVGGSSDPLASIGGLVFEDLNGNGVHEPGLGEGAIAGVTLNLLSAGIDGLFGTGDDIVYPAEVSAGDGTYSFIGLAPATYRVSVDPDTFSPGADVTTLPNPRTISLAAGEQIGDSDFGLLLPGADLSITKSASVNEVALGGEFTYTIEVTNNGPGEADGVVVTDPLPSGVEYVDAVASQGTVGESGGVVTAELGTLLVGESATVTITVRAVDAGLTENTAVVDSDTTDTDETNNETTPPVSVDVLPTADLSITKSASVTEVAQGVEFSYEIVVTNNGPNDAQNVVVTDALPAGVEYVSAVASQGTAGEAGGVVTAELGTLLVGESATVTITVRAVDAGATENTAVVDSDTTDTDETNNETTPPVSVDVLPTADLSVTKSASVSEIAQGGEFSYEIVVTNNGPSDAENVVVTDPLPAGVEYVSGSADQGTVDESGGVVTADLGTVGVQQTVIITITVKAVEPGLTENTAVVDSDTTDTDTDNNETTPVVEVDIIPVANLSITKVASVTEVAQGGEFTYEIVVTNNGPSDAENVVVTDALPAGVEFVGATGSQGTGGEAGGVVTAELGTLLVGESATVTITVRAIDAGATENTASVDSDTTDTDTDNNETTPVVEVDILPAADLSVTKSAEVTEVLVGEEFTYTIEVANNGPSDAENVVVTDILPAGVEYVSGSADQGTVDESGGVVTADLGTVAVEQTVVITITVRAVTPGLTENTASVDADTTDTETDNNETTPVVEVDILPAADLSVTKSASVAEIAQGGEFTYEIVVTNNGPSDAENVVVTDALPAGVEFVDAVASQGTAGEAGGVVTAELGMIPAEGSATVTITVRAVDAGLTENTASVDSDTTDTDTDNNETTPVVEVDIIPAADLSISKSADVTTALPDQEFGYEIVVTNAGPSEAENVVVTDILPAGVEYVSGAATQGSVDELGGVVTVTLGTLAADTSATITITVKAGLTAGVTENTAVVEGDTTDTDTGNNVSDPPTVVEILGDTDLEITKSASASTVPLGQEFTYTIEVFNSSDVVAQDVVVTDVLPAGVEFVDAVASQGTAGEAGGVVTAQLGLLPGQATATVTITVRAIEVGETLNTASVDSASTDTNPDNNETTPAVQVDIVPAADLAISKSADAETVLAGEEFSYEIVVTNNGPSDAENVVVTDALPAGVEYVSGSADQGTVDESGGVVTADLGTVAVQQTVVITITVRAVEPGLTENTASVDSDTTDTDTDNNETTPVVEVDIIPVANLSIAKVASADEVAEGVEYTYTIEVTNNGPSDAENVVVTDNLPSEVEFVDAVASQGTAGEAGGVVTAELGTLLVGESATVTITVRALVPGMTANTASVDSDTTDPDTDDNDTSVPVNVDILPAADLSVTKSAEVTEVLVGEEFTYTIVVANNNGPSDAENVVVTDVLPAGVEYVSGSADQGTVDESGGVVTADLGTVAVEQTVVITITVRAVTPGLTENTASVDADTTDTETDNNETTPVVEVDILPAADLSVTKSASVSEVMQGSEFTYTIEVTNNGPSDAENVVVTDVLPAGVEYVSGVADQGTVDESGGVVTADLGTVAEGQTVVITITVIGFDPGPTENTASVASETTDTDTDNNETTPVVEVDILPLAELAISKSADVTTALPGQEFTYTIVVLNNGPSEAENVVVTDILPAGVEYVSGSADQGTVDELGGVVTANVGTMDNEQQVVITITVRAVDPGPTVNTAVVESTTTETDTNDNVSDPPTVVQILGETDLAIFKSASASTVPLGQEFTYTIEVVNNSEVAAYGGTTTDVLPLGVEFVSATASQGTVTEDGGVVLALLGLIEGNTTATITITVRGIEVGETFNTALVDYVSTDTDPSNNETSPPVQVDIIPAADLAISKSASVDEAIVAEEFTYTIEVTNNGPSDAENVVVTDVLAAGLEFVDAVASQGTAGEAGGVVTAELGTLPEGATATITITVKGVASGLTQNTASVDSDTTDTDTDNNETTPVVEVDILDAADLSITKTASATGVAQGQEFTYTIQVSNPGPSDAENVVVTDTLPSGVAFVSASASQGTANHAAGVVTADLGTIAVGGGATITITVRGVVAGTTENTASVETDTLDPDAENNETTPVVTVDIYPNADVRIDKSASVGSIPIEQTFTYTLTVTNDGPSAASDVLVTDVLPAGVEFVSAVSTQGFVGVNGQTVSADIGTMTSGQVVTVTLTVRGTQTGTVFNTAVVDSATSDTNPENNEVEEAVAVELQPSADLILFKVGDPVVVASGSDLTYFIVVANTGPSDATDVTVVDALPQGCVELISMSTLQGTIGEAGGIVTANLGTLPAGEATLVKIVVQPSGTGAVVNSASVTAVEFDPNLANNTDTEVTQLDTSYKPQMVDLFTTSTGWFPFKPNFPGLHSTEYDPTENALKTRVFADPVRYRQNGLFSLQQMNLPYASVGSQNYVRGKFHVYTGDQANLAQLNSIPALRVRLSNRFAVTSMLEVFPFLNSDPAVAPYSLELRPSQDKTKPSVYRVDFDPVDVPFLAGNPNTEGIMRGFEAVALNPQTNGYIALKEIELGVYPRGLLDNCRQPVKVFVPSASDAGDFRSSLPGSGLLIQNLLLTSQDGYTTPSLDPGTSLPLHLEGPFGVTLDTRQVPANRVGVITREFSGGADVTSPDYLRVEEGKQYKIRFHLTSTQQSNLNPQIRMRARSVRFMWSQKLEVGGAWATGSGNLTQNNIIAQQALPGIGNENPEKNGNPNGGWYTMIFHSPLNVDIRPEFDPDQGIESRMPNLSSQPGPGQEGASVRDLRLGLDMVDTITVTPNSRLEKGDVTVDRIEVREYPLVDDDLLPE